MSNTSGNGHSDDALSPGAYEEYWYDALGRRVLKRSRQESPICTNSNRCTSTIERIVWDGDQILWEVRQADAGDTQNPSGSQYAGQTGHVGYVHAGGLDAPIAIIRNGTGVVLHRNWRGLYAAATKDNGAEVSATVYWPGVNWDLKLGYVDTRNTDDWYGSLVKGHQDRTGLTYQRNRYYDPRSGQFTQQDPIGIAGGLNLYGYANGDPINFRDPFGLCPEEQRDEDGRCPGGLEVGEWEAVEAAMEYMDSELSTKVREHLDAGRIKSSNLPQTWQGFTNPFTSTVHLNNDLPLGSALDPEVVRSTQLAFILAHEFGHVDGLSRGRLRYELGLLLSKTFFEMKADFYACSHTTAGQTINAESCLVPGR